MFGPSYTNELAIECRFVSTTRVSTRVYPILFNRTPHSFCIVVPFTRTNRGARSHVLVVPPEGGLEAPSFAMCEQEKSLSISHFRNVKGEVDKVTLQTIQEMVGMFIDCLR